MTVTTLPVFSLKLFKQFCPSSTIPGGTVPNPSDNWLPVADTVVTLPTAPPIVTAPETIPGNSAPVDGCFDPDNVDYSQIFNNLLPQEDVEGVYDESLDTDVLIQGKNEIVPIRGVTRLVFGLITSKYDLTPKFTDVSFSTKLKVELFRIKESLPCAVGSFTLVGQSAGRTEIFSGGAGSFGLIGYDAGFVLTKIVNPILSADTGSLRLNYNPLQVLLLSHFDADLSEEVGLAFPYSYHQSNIPTIDTSTKKFGAGSLNLTTVGNDYLYTFIPEEYLDDPTTDFVFECWVYRVSTETITALAIGKQADPGGYSYAFVFSGSSLLLRRYPATGGIDTLFNIPYSGGTYGGVWSHIALEQSSAGLRVYLNGVPQPTSNFGSTFVYSPVYRLNLSSALFIGGWAQEPGETSGATAGRFDEVRLVSQALYEGATFTPPDNPYDAVIPSAGDANFLVIQNAQGATGSFTLTGQTANFIVSSFLFPETGAITLTGQDVSFARASRVLIANGGHVAYTGKATVDLPVFVGATTAAGNAISGVTVNLPTGTSEGDLLLLFVETSAELVSGITPPALGSIYGWKYIESCPYLNNDGSNKHYLNGFYRVHKLSHGRSFYVAVETDHSTITVTAWRNVSSLAPFSTAAITKDSVGFGDVNFPALTGDIPRTAIVYAMATGRDISSALTLSSTSNSSSRWTDVGTRVTTATNNNNGGQMLVYQANTLAAGSGLPITTSTPTNYTTDASLATYALTPAINTPVDVYQSRVQMLLRMNGYSGSNLFYDSSPIQATVTPTNAVQYSATQSKYDGVSAYFDGIDGTGLIVTKNGLATSGTEDFTLELWIYATDASKFFNTLVSMNPNGIGTLYAYYNGVVGQFLIYWYTDESTLESASLSENTWHHVALVRLNGVIKLYVNGVSDNVTHTEVLAFSSTFTVGFNSEWTDETFVGYMEDVRYTKGVARYTANFMPPNIPL